MDLTRGFDVRIVIETDAAGEQILVKSSMVCDVEGETAILAQTYPPIPESMLGKDITVTFLTRKNGNMVREGFSARIVEFIDRSRSPDQIFKALKVERIGEPKPYCVRMCYRVRPMNQCGLSMTIYGTKVSVIDISLGGAKISYHQSLELMPHTLVNVSLDVDGRTYVIEAHILRTWNGASVEFTDDLWFAALKFTYTDKRVEDALSQKIRDIERQALRKGMIP